jgi:hypothetical protein
MPPCLAQVIEESSPALFKEMSNPKQKESSINPLRFIKYESKRLVSHKPPPYWTSVILAKTL